MAEQGACLQSYNNELVKSIEELTRRRAQLNDQIKIETLEKSQLEAEKTKIEEKLSTVECSLKKKLTDRAEYDKVIGDAEQVGCNIYLFAVSNRNLFSRPTARFSSPARFCSALSKPRALTCRTLKMLRMFPALRTLALSNQLPFTEH